MHVPRQSALGSGADSESELAVRASHSEGKSKSASGIRGKTGSLVDNFERL